MATKKKLLTPPIKKKKPASAYPNRTDIFADSRQQSYIDENPVIPNDIPRGSNPHRWKKPQPVVKKTTKKR